VEGSPSVADEPLAGSGEFRTGELLVTDDRSKARIIVGVIGEVDVEPNSRLRLLHTDLTNHRIAVEKGTIHARIWAPPRLFFVETPSALAVDLGCAYTLAVDETGASVLRVTSGFVALEHDEREVYVPAGAMCVTRPGIGPGTPFFEDASGELRSALLRYDFDTHSPALLDTVVSMCRNDDVLTLWHLLKISDRTSREKVYARLSAAATPPRGVTRDGILAGDARMLNRWRESMGLGVSGWW
jgi:hypothetical protein